MINFNNTKLRLKQLLTHLQPFCRYFENPTPDRDVVIHKVSHFRVAVAYALKGSKVCQTLMVEFRQDVYFYLFGHKGYQQGNWRVLEKDDFSEQYTFSQTSRIAFGTNMGRVL